MKPKHQKQGPHSRGGANVIKTDYGKGRSQRTTGGMYGPKPSAQFKDGGKVRGKDAGPTKGY